MALWPPTGGWFSAQVTSVQYKSGEQLITFFFSPLNFYFVFILLERIDVKYIIDGVIRTLKPHQLLAADAASSARPATTHMQSSESEG